MNPVLIKIPAWQACNGGYSSNGTCSYPDQGQRKEWAVYAQFYRRNATLIFSRSTLTIREVDYTSPAQRMKIVPSDLFEGINRVFFRPMLSTNDRRYDTFSETYIRTALISESLLSAVQDQAASLHIGRDWLRNLLALPLYVFQPTVLAQNGQVSGITNGTVVAPNLPGENYVEGSYCIGSNRAVPAFPFVLAYTVAAGLVLGFVTLGKLICSQFEHVETSDFPLLDFRALTEIINEEPESIELNEVLSETVYAEGRLFNQVEGLNVMLRQR